MREMANTIETEVLAELDATRKRLHQMASDFVGCNTLTIQVSTCRSTFRAKVKSHMSCRKGAASRERCFNGVREVLNAMKVNRTFLCNWEGLTTDIADLVPTCTPSAKETLGM